MTEKQRQHALELVKQGKVLEPHDHFENAMRDTISFSINGIDFEIEYEFRASMGNIYSVDWYNRETGASGMCCNNTGVEAGMYIEAVLGLREFLQDEEDEPNLFNQSEEE